MALPNRTASVFVRSDPIHRVMAGQPHECGHYERVIAGQPHECGHYERVTAGQPHECGHYEREMAIRPRTSRRAALIVEAVIALLLLSTATVALTKLAKSSAALGRQSDERLVATLAAENTIQRLQGVAVEELSDQADQVADLVAQDAGCEIDDQWLLL